MGMTKMAGFKIETEDVANGYVKAEVTLGGFPIFSDWYSLTGPDRFDTAATYALDQVAQALSEITAPAARNG